MNKILILIIFLTSILYGDNEIPFLKNSRLSYDLTSRVSYFERAEKASFQHFMGLEIFKVFHTNNQDLGQLLIQPFIHRIDNGVRTPAYYDDKHDTEFIWRTVTFTYTGFGNNFPWIKIGHFEVPFGIEYTKNTFGNLHQYGQSEKIGFKMDWGLALGQQLKNWQYEFSATRGSGLKYKDRHSPSAFAGRISTLNDSQWSTGLSIFSGELLRNKDTSKRKLLALDFEHHLQSLSLVTEIHAGKNEDDDMFGGLFEANWLSRDEQNEIYLQYQYQDIQTQENSSAIKLGTKYQLSPFIALSAQLTFEIDRNPENSRSSLIEFQLRYIF